MHPNRFTLMIGKAAFWANEGRSGAGVVAHRVRKSNAPALVRKEQRAALREIGQKAVKLHRRTNLWQCSTPTLFSSLNHVCAQSIFLDLIRNAALHQDGYKTRDAKFTGFFGDPIIARLANGRGGKQKIGNTFAFAQLLTY